MIITVQTEEIFQLQKIVTKMRGNNKPLVYLKVFPVNVLGSELGAYNSRR